MKDSKLKLYQPSYSLSTEKLKLVTFITKSLFYFKKEKIVGFDQLGGHDDFSQEMLEWRLGISKVINYKGDLSTPPGLDLSYI